MVVPGRAACIPLAKAVAKAGACICANVCPVLTVCVTKILVDRPVEVGAGAVADKTAEAAARPDRYAPCTVAG